MFFSSLASNLFAMKLAHLVKPVGYLLAWVLRNCCRHASPVRAQGPRGVLSLEISYVFSSLHGFLSNPVLTLLNVY